MVVEHFRSGIVVETKAPGKKLDNYLGQLEGYVFRKHGPDRVTVAILTDGEKFSLYGVTGAFYTGSLEDHWILSFTRSELGSAALLAKLDDLVGKRSNQEGAISIAIARYRKEKGERAEGIESELLTLEADFNRRKLELETELKKILSSSIRNRNKQVSSTPSNGHSRVSSPHILRLLKGRDASSRSQGVDRRWLDEQLINKVEGINSNQEVSFWFDRTETKTTGRL